MRPAALFCAVALFVGLPVAQAEPPERLPGPGAEAAADTAGAAEGIAETAAAADIPLVADTAPSTAPGPVDPKAEAKARSATDTKPGSQAPRSSLKPRHLLGGKGWSGSQFLQADKKGRLFVLRAATLDVYPLSSDGALGEAKHLSNGDSPQASGECSVSGSVPEVTGQCLVLNAAMSRDGDWVVQDGIYARVFRGNKEEPTEKPGLYISGLAFQDDDPVIAGHPHAVDYALARHQKPPDTLATLSRLSAGKWETLSSSPTAMKDGTRGLWEHQMLLLASTADGHLWTGSLYQHRFREYNRAGKLLTQIAVGDGAVRRAPNAEARQRASDEIARELSKSKLQISITEMTGEPVTLALAEGTDGRMYFLIRNLDGGESGVFLERYEAASGAFERLPVALEGTTSVTMAAGKDGLFVAPMPAAQGIWALSWDQLRDAKWEPVEAKVGSGASGDAPAKTAETADDDRERPLTGPLPAADQRIAQPPR